jgi:hypothetical protein
MLALDLPQSHHMRLSKHPKSWDSFISNAALKDSKALLIAALCVLVHDSIVDFNVVYTIEVPQGRQLL